MKRKNGETDENMIYTSPYLKKLQAYEDTGWQPWELTPKPDSVAAIKADRQPQQKHKIRLIRKETGGKSDFWMVNLDGKEIKLCEFAKVMGLNNGTVSSWVQRGIFEKRVKELGLV